MTDNPFHRDNPFLRPASPPPAPPAAPKLCGHNDPSTVLDSQATITFAQLPDYHSDSSETRFVGLYGGQQRLMRARCEDCTIATGYTLSRTPDGTPESIGYDADILSAAVNALLGQPAVDVFTLVVDRDVRERIVLPRHYLPTLIIRGP